MSQHYFAQVSPGLESLLRAELKALGARKLKLDTGGVHFQGTRKHLYRALLWSASANRVYRTLIDATAPQTDALFARVIKFDWTSLVESSRIPLPLAIRVSMSATSVWEGSGEVESIVFKAIERALMSHRRVTPHAWSSDAGKTRGVLRLLVRIAEGRVTLRVDATGDLMHRRGWRREEGNAPLRPTLAAAMLTLLNWRSDEPLYDPMCGSGTLVIEAGRRALNLSPRLWRGYACQDWADFNHDLWTEMRAAPALNASHTKPEAAQLGAEDHDESNPETLWRLFASDVDAHAVALTQHHLTKAEVKAQVWVHDIHNPDFAPPVKAPGLIVFNPPYGLRVIDGGELKALLHHFARERTRWEGWRVGFIYPRQLTPPKVEGLRYEECARFQHGGLPVWVWCCTHATAP